MFASIRSICRKTLELLLPKQFSQPFYFRPALMASPAMVMILFDRSKKWSAPPLPTTRYAAHMQHLHEEPQPGCAVARLREWPSRSCKKYTRALQLVYSDNGDVRPAFHPRQLLMSAGDVESNLRPPLRRMQKGHKNQYCASAVWGVPGGVPRCLHRPHEEGETEGCQVKKGCGEGAVHPLWGPRSQEMYWKKKRERRRIEVRRV